MLLTKLMKAEKKSLFVLSQAKNKKAAKHAAAR